VSVQARVLDLFDELHREPYTQRLLASLPVPDPDAQAERRAQWEALRAADESA